MPRLRQGGAAREVERLEAKIDDLRAGFRAEVMDLRAELRETRRRLEDLQREGGHPGSGPRPGAAPKRPRALRRKKGAKQAAKRARARQADDAEPEQNATDPVSPAEPPAGSE